MGHKSNLTGEPALAAAPPVPAAGKTISGSAQPINTWAADERPREKLVQKGPAALSDAELLAILIGNGTVARSALDLARDILLRAENLSELGRLSLKELQQTKGIGSAKAVTIAAALEIGKRRRERDGLQRKTISCGADAAEIFQSLLGDLPYEAFAVIYLNQGNRLLKKEIISQGGLTGTVADTRIILKNALLHNAAAIIVSHNHPSGNLTPSAADKTLTQKLMDSARTMDIKLLDHVIVGGGRYISLADEGLI